MPDTEPASTAEAAASDLTRALPDGTRLLHIGPPKTGTTSLQAALHAARGDLLAQGVRYAGQAQHSRRIAYAGIREREYAHRPAPPDPRLWDAFAAEVREAGERCVVVSSEIFTDGDDDAMRRVIADLEPERVHVVVTLRPLVRILSSQWQQALKGGLVDSLEDWLHEVFDEGGAAHRRFWRRHRHDELVARWAAAVGPGRLTVVVVDDRDHGFILRAFEGLMGVRAGTLPTRRDIANRSMTLDEAETLRAWNRSFRRAGLRSQRAHAIRQNAVRAYLASHRPGPDEVRITAPVWALERAAAIATEAVEGIRASGVPVIGDLDRLLPPATADAAATAGPAALPRPRIPATMRLALVSARLAEFMPGSGRSTPGRRTPGRRS